MNNIKFLKIASFRSISIFHYTKPFIRTNQRSFSYAYIKNEQDKYIECFKILNINEDSDQHAARKAFIKLAKKYHPDSGHQEADELKFHRVENAYKLLLEKFSKDRRNNDCEGEYGLYYDQKRKDAEENANENMYDIKHTAPQHRQYLSYEGIGMGTPSQREKQFTKFRAMRAAETVIDYKIQQLGQDKEETALTTRDQKAVRDIRTRYGIDRLVEDKIQESMARGDFDNLPNAGKPLKFQNYNPFVDNVTHKLNEVLIESGYAPEWVVLEREIRDDKIRIKKKLENCRCKLGSCPLTKREEHVWATLLAKLATEVDELNKKIDKYNLVVPIMTKQTVHFPLTKVVEKILQEGKTLADDSGHQMENRRDELPSDSTPKESVFRAFIGMFKER